MAKTRSNCASFSARAALSASSKASSSDTMRRHSAALEARFAELSSVSDYFLALADYRAATAEELR